MGKIVKLTESDLSNIISKVIIEQNNDDLPRRIYDHRITPEMLKRYKDNGLSLYYFVPQDGKDYGIKEFNRPFDSKNYSNNRITLFALTTDEYNKVNKVSENIKEMTELYRQKINTLKQMVPAIMNELIKKHGTEK